jgi:hypothetical protein
LEGALELLEAAAGAGWTRNVHTSERKPSTRSSKRATLFSNLTRASTFFSRRSCIVQNMPVAPANAPAIVAQIVIVRSLTASGLHLVEITQLLPPAA